MLYPGTMPRSVSTVKRRGNVSRRAVLHGGPQRRSLERDTKPSAKLPRQDRRREREARARGDEFRRYTYRDVTEDAALVAGELRPLLNAPETPRRAAALA